MNSIRRIAMIADVDIEPDPDVASLRFHGYRDAQWTDSAVRRYITDAGPLLQRLHRLTRADCTTRNQRKAARLARAYDDLEERIERLLEQEELEAVRPELDGNEIGAVLGIPPGPEIGQAYRYLLQVRLDEGPIGRDAATDRPAPGCAARRPPRAAADRRTPRARP